MHTENQFLRPELKNFDLQSLDRLLDNANPTWSISWAAEAFGDGLVMSTSFGIHSAVMLHLVTRIYPDIPVIWIDTGYLFPETYRFAEQLTERLKLNLKIYQSPISPSRMEAKYGNLWEQDNVESFNLYHRLRKLEPMQQALEELNATAWIAGLLREQTKHRQTLSTISKQGEYYKILPILHWTAKDVYYYLQTHNLPYHPLFDRGYVTVGDWHSSRPMFAGDLNERDTRFKGLKQECGLHLN